MLLKLYLILFWFIEYETFYNLPSFSWKVLSNSESDLDQELFEWYDVKMIVKFMKMMTLQKNNQIYEMYNPDVARIIDIISDLDLSE